MANAKQIVCPACGGPLQFNSKLQKMKCEYCESVFTVQELEELNAQAAAASQAAQSAGTQSGAVDGTAQAAGTQAGMAGMAAAQSGTAAGTAQAAQSEPEAADFTAEEEEYLASESEADDTSGIWSLPHAEWNRKEKNDLRVYTCSGCSAAITTDSTTVATTCPYCGSPVVVSGQISGEKKPDLIIPFKLDKDAAVKGMADHLKDKKLLPKAFTRDGHLEEVKGVYMPFWLYSAKAYGEYILDAEQISVWTDTVNQYTKTDIFELDRKGNVSFENVPVDGSSRMPNDMSESIEPYDFSELKPFSSTYLSGYFANRYDEDAEKCIPRAEQRIVRSAEDTILSSVHGFDNVRVRSGGIHIRKGQVKYALLPVWLLSTKWQDKIYLFAMNGQTGVFVGDLPEDKSIALKMQIGLTAIIFAVLLLLTFVVVKML